MRKSIVLGLGFLFAFVLAQEAFGDSWCNTRNRCRSWRAQYVASTKVGCWEISRVVPLCYRRQSGCVTVSANCGQRNCLSGSASGYATNGPGGCNAGGSRSGLGWYGDELQNPPDGFENAQGDHELQSRVSFDADSQNVDIFFDTMRMTSTVDDAFSRVDVWVYLEPDHRTEEEPEPTAENTVWHGYLLSQNGRLTQKGFDDLVDQFTNDGEITSLEVADFVKTVPYFGSAEDFENLSVKILVDGGIPQEEESSPSLTQ